MKSSFYKNVFYFDSIIMIKKRPSILFFAFNRNFDERNHKFQAVERFLVTCKKLSKNISSNRHIS